MAPSGVGGLENSSSSSIFFQVDGQSQGIPKSNLNSSFGRSTNSIQAPGRSSLVAASGNVNNVVTSGPCIAESSLVTDANSALPNLQRSVSFNTDLYMRVPTSPLSFSSNNRSISGSTVIDGSSGVTSLPPSQVGQISISNVTTRGQGQFMQDPNYVAEIHKRTDMDVKKYDITQKQALQQIPHRHDTMQFNGHSPQFQAMVQQQLLHQQQQKLLQSLPHIKKTPIQQHQQQEIQLRHQLQQQQQGLQQHLSGMKRSFDFGVCARRLMQYLYHQRQRPNDNNIAYWRKFVVEYFSPRAKKRWCLSLYENVGQHVLGVFPQSAMDAWRCDICNSKSGRGFEATFEVLPRLNEINFSSGVVDDLLFLDLPSECRLPNGVMILEYRKAVQESVYAQFRLIREGKLRIIFAPDLKILSWEFCAQRHEELLPRRLIAPQVNRLIQAAQKCQNTISDSGSDGISQQDLQSSSNMILATGRQLTKSLELHSLNDLGFSKRFVRCLQISEVVSSMKDLVAFCKEQKIGPIEGLKNYPRHASAMKFQMQEMGSLQGFPMDRNTLNKLMALNPGLSMVNNNDPQYLNRGLLMMRQNCINSNHNPPHQPEIGPISSSLTTNSQNGLSFQNVLETGLSSPLCAQCPQVSNVNVSEQTVQEMNNNNGRQAECPAPNKSCFKAGPDSDVSNGLVQKSQNLCQNKSSFNVVSDCGASNGFEQKSQELCQNKSSFKVASDCDASNGFEQKLQDMYQNAPILDDLLEELGNEFSDAVFNYDLDGGMGFDWKGD